MKGYLFILAFSVSATSFAQFTIRGSVTDGQHHLQGVTVLLLKPDSVLVTGVITDSTGGYFFDNVGKGSYIISALMIGFARYISPPVIIADGTTDLGEIRLHELATELGEVVVGGDRQLFQQRPDRLIINLQSSISSSGNTILEVLQKFPGIVVNRQNNSIIMNGRSGVRVMINNRAMELPADAVVQMLDGMNASNVERIELITSPEARYDANGNAGIIHIITKVNTDAGTSAAFGLTLGARWAEGLGGNVNVNHRKKAYAFFLDYAAIRNHNLHLLNLNWQSWNGESRFTVKNSSHRENITLQQNLNAGLQWTIGKDTELNLLVTGYSRNWHLTALTDDLSEFTPDTAVVTVMKISESNIWQSATGSLGLKTKINTKNHVIVTWDYLYYNNNNPSTYANSIFYERANLLDRSNIDLKKSTPIRFFVARSDYEYRMSSSLMFSAGIKAVFSQLDNNVLVRKEVDNAWVEDHEFTSYSTLNERMYAGYASAKWMLGKSEINSGLRYEYTHTAIESPDDMDILTRKYGYWFPSLTARFAFEGEKDLQFAYSRRITRPTYNDIAPFVFLWGPTTFSAGNTALFPAISDAVTGAYRVKQWNISLQFSHVKREITTLQPEVDVSLGKLTYKSENLRYLKTLALANSWTLYPAWWWEIQGNVTAQYQVSRALHLADRIEQDLYGVSINMVNIFRLPKEFSIEISGNYQSRLLSGISTFLPSGSLNAGIQKIMGRHGTIRLAMDDILYTNYWRIETHLPQSSFDSQFDYDWHNQFIRLTYTRSLGNNRLRQVKLRSGAEEEIKRIGH